MVHPRHEPEVDPQLRRARDQLEAHPAERVPLAELARVAGPSPFHFARAFRAAYGPSPHTYRLRLRVERAKALLAIGHPVRDAVAATGFASATHLQRHFRRLTGLTPGQFRESARSLKSQGTGEPYPRSVVEGSRASGTA